MKNNESYKLSDTSLIYRFITWAEDFPLLSWIVPEHNLSYYNLCTLIRTLFFLLSFIVLSIVLLGYGIYNVFSFEIKSLFINDSSLIVASTFYFFSFAIVLAIQLIGYYLLYPLLMKADEKYSEYSSNKPEKESKPNIIIQTIRDKHNNICRSFEVVSKNDKTD